MSSHREAPEIAKDPVADSTDTYAFVSPDMPDTVTFIANFIPLQQPDGGPNFYEFGDDVLYMIHISNRGKGESDISYEFEFTTKVRDRTTFLYNTGPINSITDKTWNRPQTYKVTRVEGDKRVELGRGIPCPPVNVGARSTPNYDVLAQQAVHRLKGGRTVYAGQRADAFHVDLGSVFDLVALRPFNDAHLIKLVPMAGLNAVQSYNVHTIALQVPITDLTRDGSRPTDVMSPKAVIGMWSSASRRKSRIFDSKKSKYVGVGPWTQVSRLGNPLFNEVLVPMVEKDKWNNSEPAGDKDYARYVEHPELGAKIPVLYPVGFPHLAAYKKARADLVAILLTGLPKGVVPGFQNYTGPVLSDMLRLNLAVKPAAVPNPLGVIAGDLAGYPNGRRVDDDVVTIEVRAIAGVTIPLVDTSYVPDAPALVVADGTTNTNNALLPVFPYLGLPGGGYQTIPGVAPSSGQPSATVPVTPPTTPPVIPPVTLPNGVTVPAL